MNLRPHNTHGLSLKGRNERKTIPVLGNARQETGRFSLGIEDDAKMSSTDKADNTNLEKMLDPMYLLVVLYRYALLISLGSDTVLDAKLCVRIVYIRSLMHLLV